MSSSDPRTFKMAKETILSMCNDATTEEKMQYYDRWAQTYEQAAAKVSAHFSGDRQAATVLDVACGTGMVAKMMKKEGFQHFVGVDGSEGMLQRARQSGLYRDVKKALIGDGPLPVASDEYDVVVITGALSSSHLPPKVIRELCRVAKAGGFICMTGKGDGENQSYKAALEGEMKQMEDGGLWRRVDVTNVNSWQRDLIDEQKEYMSGCVYLYQKL
ncbi:methyltransferase-like protein 27 isoform X2 [Stigmatopora argus]